MNIYSYFLSKSGFPDIMITCERSLIQEDVLYYIQTESETKTCVNVTIYPNHYIEHSKDKSNIATMSWVVAEDLQKDSGTYHLLRSVLQFIREKFERVQRIELDDSRYCICKDPFGKENPRKVMLVHYNIALYDASWYQKVIQAYILPETIQKQYEEGKKLLQDTSTKLPWAFFSRKYAIVDTDGKIQETYMKHSTYRDFFLELRKEEEKYCWYISKWIVPFINDILGNIPLTKWNIDIQTIETYDIDISPTKGGNQNMKRTLKKRYVTNNLPKGFNQTEFDLAYEGDFPYR